MKTLAVAAGLLLIVVACRRTAAPAPVLLFNGAGTSRGDVAAVETILQNEHLDYAIADSADLNAMSPPALRAHRLLIVPGGNFIEMGDGLSAAATANVREAVQQGGLNYLGICGGAFLAGHIHGQRNLDLTGGVQFGFYAAEARGIRKAPVVVTGPGGQTLEQYWEDGPQLTGWGQVVGRYPDGTPAIVEGASGRGWVVLAGVHPEAPESWRRGMTFTTPASADNAFAATLVHAALERAALARD